jgi:hypothetical protein
MKTAPDNNWLEQFRLVKVTRRIEEDIKLHRQEMAVTSGDAADWDSALVDWTIHAAHDHLAKERELSQY